MFSYIFETSFFNFTQQMAQNWGVTMPFGAVCLFTHICTISQTHPPKLAHKIKILLQTNKLVTKTNYI
jgi:hypothetical protein